MFDFLKQKIQGFTDKLKGALQAKPEEKPITPPVVETVAEPSPTFESEKEPIAEEPTPVESPNQPEPVEEEVEPVPAAAIEPVKPTPPTEPIPKKEAEKTAPKKGIFSAIAEIVSPTKKTEEKVVKKEMVVKPTPVDVEPVKEKIIVEEKKAPAPAGKSGLNEVTDEEKRDLKAKPGLFTQVKSFFASEITVEESDIRDFLFELELALLESDVEQTTANAIVDNLRHELVGKKAPKNEGLDVFLKKEIRKSLQVVMTVPGLDFWERIESKKPFVIMILGPNGAGKTTSIAKMTYLLQQKKKTVVWASADTFRSGAIEQLETHANRLNVRLIKHDYGADPAAVAFDAVKSAQSMNADVVLIDTAGRQETNTNLMKELEKINRVVKPDLKIYVGEAFTGQALLAQAKEFNQTIGIDGFILSKMDTDAKGGTCISVLHQLQKPVLFVGVGQRYEDLIPFEPDFILDRIL